MYSHRSTVNMGETDPPHEISSDYRDQVARTMDRYLELPEEYPHRKEITDLAAHEMDRLRLKPEFFENQTRVTIFLGIIDRYLRQCDQFPVTGSHHRANNEQMQAIFRSEKLARLLVLVQQSSGNNSHSQTVEALMSRSDQLPAFLESFVPTVEESQMWMAKLDKARAHEKSADSVESYLQKDQEPFRCLIDNLAMSTDAIVAKCTDTVVITTQYDSREFQREFQALGMCIHVPEESAPSANYIIQPDTDSPGIDSLRVSVGPSARTMPLTELLQKNLRHELAHAVGALDTSGLFSDVDRGTNEVATELLANYEHVGSTNPGELKSTFPDRTGYPDQIDVFFDLMQALPADEAGRVLSSLSTSYIDHQTRDLDMAVSRNFGLDIRANLAFMDSWQLRRNELDALFFNPSDIADQVRERAGITDRKSLLPYMGTQYISHRLGDDYLEYDIGNNRYQLLNPLTGENWDQIIDSSVFRKFAKHILPYVSNAEVYRQILSGLTKKK